MQLQKSSTESELKSDETLVNEIISGDRSALGEIFVRHAPSVRRLISSIMGPRQDLDDLVQEVFLNVYRSIGTFRGTARFSTWLHRVTVNTTLSLLRRPVRLYPCPAEDLQRRADPTCNQEQSLLVQETIRHLFKILDSLSHKRRVAFTLFAIEGLSIKEICEATGAPAAVIKSRIFFARKEIFAKAGDDPCLSPLLDELGS